MFRSPPEPGPLTFCPLAASDLTLRTRDRPVQTAVGLLSEAESGHLHRVLVGLVEGVFVALPEWMSPLRQRSSAFRKQAIKLLEGVVAGEGEPLLQPLLSLLLPNGS